MKTLCCPLTSVKRDCLVFSGEICMEWDDYLRQQAATYRQLAEKAEDAVVKKTPRLGRRLRRGRQQHRGSSYKRVNGMSRFRTRLEGLDFNLHPKKPMAFCSTPTETLYGSAAHSSRTLARCYPGPA